MNPTDSDEQKSGKTMGRCLLLLIVLAIAGIELFVSFRGLFEPAAMDQAQIARQIARGDGMSTKFLRPVQVMDQAAENRGVLDFDAMSDANYAPLYPHVLALALSITGADDVDANRMEEGGSVIYGPDRVVAGVSMIFFLIALFLSYLVAWKLFDEAVAVATVLMMLFSSVMLQFATSGLPQPLMMCFFLGSSLMMIFACEAQAKHQSGKRVALYVGLSFCLMALLCLTSWMCIWLAIGLLIFVGAYLRPYGFHAGVGAAVLIVFLILPYLHNMSVTGSALGNAFYAIYNQFGEGEELVLRSTVVGDLPLDDKNFILRVFGAYFGQLQHFYEATGAILVAIFFFLTIFHSYRAKATQRFKWALLFMYASAALGVLFFGSDLTIHVSQIYIVMAPLFVAYGTSIVFSLLAKSVKGEDFALTRNFVVFVFVVISSGPLLFSYPKEVYRGIWLGSKGIPHWPPYYPNALNLKLVDTTNADDIIVTDQPWAVAWYADRKALWTPMKVESFTKDLMPIITNSGCDVQGFLFTPSSYWQDSQAADSVGGLTGVVQKTGEFTPAAIEGMLLLESPKKNFFYGDLFDSSDVKGVGSLLSSNGVYGRRVAILGAHMLYYAKNFD